MYLIIIAIVLTLLFSQSKQFDRGKTCIWVCFCLFSISACKSVFAYVDLIGYRNRYLTLGGMSITRLWEQYVAGDMKDFGFYAIAKLFSKLGLSTEIWMAAIALFFAVCVCLCFYRASEDIFISLMGLLALYFRFTLSGLRQTLALGLVLLAYITIVDKKLPAYILLMTAAFLCHSSSLIFLPAYWIVRIKVNFKQIVIVIAALGIYTYKRERDYRQLSENEYNMAFYELVDYVQNVETYLAKSLISSTPEHGAEILTHVWREANLAQSYLARLPIGSQELANTNKFLNQVSDYSFTLSRKNIYN